MWHSAIIWFISSCCRKKRGEVDHDVEKDNLEAADSDGAGLTQTSHTQFILQGQVIAPPSTKPK